MSALRVGAELVTVFTAYEASIPIKSYSPELMVTSVYKHEQITSASKDKQAGAQRKMVSIFFERLSLDQMRHQCRLLL